MEVLQTKFREVWESTLPSIPTVTGLPTLPLPKKKKKSSKPKMHNLNDDDINI